MHSHTAFDAWINPRSPNDFVVGAFLEEMDGDFVLVHFLAEQNYFLSAVHERRVVTDVHNRQVCVALFVMEWIGYDWLERYLLLSSFDEYLEA